ncbi:E3 ubiquitin-protein ligase RING1 [Momordica charantia]|uniref:RING-type E3 ubiquitin transferase n=1 Tax=Momordica charantia TaxID=3673 RepID=A0A6J1CK28_MOMCH|nr:E3 ubiquitin-protein ligase RING1 [Momordica charantia]XP_022141522.1 E3 ubiquitin-protein ligase RING1 [Momordica charantia]
MSFAFNLAAGANSADRDKPFFCHQCDRAVTITVSTSSDPLCPFCNEGFLEEYENSYSDSNDDLDRAPIHFPDPFRGFNPLVFSSSSSVIDLQNPGLFSRTMRPASQPWNRNQSDSTIQPEPFDPFLFLQNHLRGIFDSGADVVFEIQGHPSHSVLSMPQNVGDYFVGPGLEQLIQLLAENDPNRYGTPPASKSAIEKLPAVTVTEDLLNSEMNQCAVCIDEFQIGIKVKQMPCKHVFHDDCLLPWLELHNSCPVCRFELPTDDSDYENRTRGRRVQENEASGQQSGLDNSGSGERVERRFRVPLWWPFGGRNEGSDSGGGNDSEEDGRPLH